MAGGGDFAPTGGRAKKGKKRKASKRLGIRMDMTPMVDIAFLLLTFFMLTTVFRAPQTMELNMPPSDVKIEIAESNLMTLRIMNDGTIFWNIGVETPQKVGMNDLRKLLLEQNKQNSKLVTLVKVDRKGKYYLMVDILDELQLANVDRFSLAPLTDADKKEVAKAI